MIFGIQAFHSAMTPNVHSVAMSTVPIGMITPRADPVTIHSTSAMTSTAAGRVPDRCE
jgi:hypothetical protein